MLNGPVKTTKDKILAFIQKQGGCSIAELTGHLMVSRQAVRMHLADLQGEGYVTIKEQRRQWGRPASIYELTPSGKQLLPKDYDFLADILVQAIMKTGGPQQMRAVLEQIARMRANSFLEPLRGKDLTERVALLSDLYRQGDEYSSFQRTGDGYVLYEHNCPFHAIAMKRPSLCSTTVCVLSNLLGSHVERVERFQNGDHRCAFLITPVTQPITSLDEFQFWLEEEHPPAKYQPRVS